MFKNEDGIKKSSSALFYCGKNVYYTPPYLNSKGASLAEEIKRICESAIQK